MHQRKILVLKTVEVVYTSVRVRHPWYAAQPEKSFAGEIIGSQNVVIHHGEEYHRVWIATLFDAHGASCKKKIDRSFVFS